MKKLLLMFAGIVLGLLTPMFAISDSIVHHKKQFSAVVQELAGGPDRSYLMETVGFETCSGEVAYIDGIKPALDAGSDTATASLKNRHTYDGVTTPDIDDFVDHMITPNDTTVGQRTHLTPHQLMVSKWFDDSEKGFLQMTDPTSRKMKALMAGYFLKQDMRIVKALFASTQQRGKDDGSNLVNVAMPASQILADITYANIDYKIFAHIKKIFMKNYVAGETIFYGMGPTEWEALVLNSGDKLNNKDYVDSAEYFKTGKLPTVFGVTPVVHPIFEDTTRLTAAGLITTGEIALHGAWTENGVTWGQFKARMENMEGPIASMKNQCVSIITESGDACRNDDLRVVNGAIVSP